MEFGRVLLETRELAFRWLCVLVKFCNRNNCLRLVILPSITLETL